MAKKLLLNSFIYRLWLQSCTEHDDYPKYAVCCQLPQQQLLQQGREQCCDQLTTCFWPNFLKKRQNCGMTTGWYIDNHVIYRCHGGLSGMSGNFSFGFTVISVTFLKILVNKRRSYMVNSEFNHGAKGSLTEIVFTGCLRNYCTKVTIGYGAENETISRFLGIILSKRFAVLIKTC